MRYKIIDDEDENIIIATSLEISDLVFLAAVKELKRKKAYLAMFKHCKYSWQ